MNVRTRITAALLVALYTGTDLLAYERDVHTWIADQAGRLYAEMYERPELTWVVTTRIGGYLGSRNYPTDANEYLAGNEPKDSRAWSGYSFIEGSFEEDTWGVWWRHFVQGPEGTDLTTGLSRNWYGDIFTRVPANYRWQVRYDVSTHGYDGPYWSAYEAAWLEFDRATAWWTGGGATTWDVAEFKTISVTMRDREKAYYHLGRAAHLLADMTLPVHVRGIPHDGTVAHKDRYEEQVKKNGTHPYMNYGIGSTRSEPDKLRVRTYASLEELFRQTVCYTAEYPSVRNPADVALRHTVTSNPATVESASVSDDARHLSSHIQSLLKDNDSYIKSEDIDAYVDALAADLLPFAVEQTAALIRLFYKQVHNTGIDLADLTLNLSSDSEVPTRVSGDSVIVTIKAQHPSGVARNRYSFALKRKVGSSWSSVSNLADQSNSITFSGLAAGIYQVTATAVNGVDKTGSKIGYFSNADISQPSNAWQDAASLGLIEGEWTGPKTNLASGKVHYYRFTMAATGTDRDYAEILITGSGQGSGDLDISLGRVSGSSFRPAKGKWCDVSSSWNNNDLRPSDPRTERLSLKGLGPGEYYVIIYGMSGLDGDEALTNVNVNFAGTESGEYRLHIRAPMPDSYEPDDTAELASPIQADGAPQHHRLPGGDVDWVKFQLNQLSEVSIATDVVLGDLNTNDLGLRITLYGPDSSGAVIATHYNAKGDARINRHGDSSLAPGTYYCRSESDTDNDIRHYTIVVTASPRILPNLPPAVPHGIAPPDGATGVNLTPTLESSPFSDWDSGDVHQASEWQMSTTSDFSSLVWQSGQTTSSKTSVTLPPGQLSYGVMYYWRVRHQDSSGIANSWSDWSIPASFTTTIGNLQVGATITPPAASVGGTVEFSATVTSSADGQPISDATVQGIVQRDSGSGWETIATVPLGWSPEQNRFMGQSSEIASSGQYRAYVVAEKDLYQDGTSEAVPFNMTIVTYTLTVEVVGSGGEITGGGIFREGQVALVAALPATGYRVKSWTGTDNDSSKANSSTVTMTSPKTVTVEFEPIPCTLEASVVGGNGSVSPTNQTYNYGQVASLVAQPDAGYRVKAWTGTDSDGSKDNGNSVTMTSDKIVTVEFERAPCTLGASVVGGHGSVSPTSQTYDYGQVASLLATPDTGYRVKAWTGTDNDGSKDNGNSVTMTSNKTVTVQFEAIPPSALSVEMVGSADPVDANDQVTYTITYGNSGHPGTNNTVITEVLPTGMSYVTASGGSVYAPSSRTITWSIGTLASETVGQTVWFVGKVDGSMAEGGTITHNQLSIRSDETGTVAAAAVTTTVRDTKPPQVSGQSPADGAEMVPCGGLVQLHVTDGGSGVRYDGGTVTIRIAGDLIYDGAHETSAGVYDTRSRDQVVRGICRRTGTAADYEFTFTPTTRFDHEQEVDVAVTASDVAGNSDTVSYSFKTQTRSFGKNAKVNSDTGTLIQDHPATATDSAGNIWVVWDQQATGADTDIYIGKLAPGGSAFGASTAVYTGANAQSHPVIAVDRNNGLYVAWQSQAANGKWDVYMSRSSNGTTWTEPLAVNVGDPNNTSSQRFPSIAADSRAPGTVYIAYEDDRAGNKDIWVATSTNGTTWTETRITSHSADQTQPKVFIDPSDSTAYILWTDARNAATQGTNIYAASSANAWNNVAVVAGASNEASAVGVAYGTIYLAWVSQQSTPASVYYRSDVGGLPIAGFAIADEPGVSQAAPSLALRRDARGTKLFAAWQDGRDVKNNNNDTDIYFAEGGWLFGTNILVNDDSGTSAQTAPAVGVDGKGNPYVVWVDERNGNKDIYYAGAVCIDAPLPTTVVTTGGKTTVRATGQANLEAEIPQMPSGVQAGQITIAEVSNPPEMPSGTNAVGLQYEFGPSGLQFATPVTIRIPLTQDPGYTTYRVYRYDPDDLTSPSFPWTESGIHNPATKVVAAGGTYLEVQVDHFSIYGAAGITVPPPGGGGGGGGGGGCALSPYGNGRPVEFMVPFVAYVLVLFGARLAYRGRRCKG